MRDFGFSDLRVVNEFAAPFEAAQLEAKSAVGAGEVMRSARRYTSLAEAIGDCTFVAGTTAIGGRGLDRPVISLREAAPEMLAMLSGGGTDAGLPGEKGAEERVALLFGSEKTGLTNAQLSHCSRLLTIPMFAPEGRHLSMNLGQAVAVCLYELSRGGFEGVRELPVMHKAGATSADRERLTALVLEAMRDSDYARRFPANARPEIVRQLANRLGDSREEAATWMGLLKLVLRAMRKEPVSTDEG